MPMSPPRFRPPGMRTAEQRKREADQHRKSDAGRAARRKVYDSAAWQDLRHAARLRDPLCVDCTAEGKTVAWTDLDHIVDMEDGGAPFDIDNVVGRCHVHHSRKTARTRGFARGRST
jgi:5-methylcytosine-specific restriction enzyme A